MIVSIGINHKTTPLEVREKLAFTSEQVRESLPRLEDPVYGGGIVLSTCNRTEIYVISQNDAAGKDRACHFLFKEKNLPQWFILSHVDCLTEEKAVEHLFRVACGMDSMVLGEDQILHQVKKAMETAESTAKCPPALSHLFHYALKAGKRARYETQISRFCLSVSHAGVEMAARALTDLSTRSALVIGAGETSKLTAKILKDHGIKDLSIINRSWERALEVATITDGKAVPIENLKESLLETDMVISSTDSPSFIIHERDVIETLKKRNGRPLLLIDMAMPRDIDPKVKKLSGVTLYDIDDLHEVCNNNMEERRKEAVKAEVIVEEEVDEFLDWWELQQNAVPTISSLVKKANRLREREIAFTLSKLQGFTHEEKERIEALTRAITSKLLHDPIAYIKKHRQDQKIMKALEDVFNLNHNDGTR